MMNVERTPEKVARDVIKLVRRELTRRASQALTQEPAMLLSEASVDQVQLPRWRPAQDGLPHKDTYTLQELLQYEDEQFVEVAYQVILRRSADPMGYEHYSQRLRTGGVSKIEILGNLRWSEEGLQRGVHVDGLLIPYTVQKWKRRRWIGPVIEWLYTLARLPRLARMQAIGGTRGAHEARRIGQLLNQVTEGIGSQSAAFAQQLAVLSAEVRRLGAHTEEVSGEQEDRIARLDELLASGDQAATEPGRMTIGGRVVRLEAGVEHALNRTAGLETVFDKRLLAIEADLHGRLEQQLEELGSRLFALEQARATSTAAQQHLEEQHRALAGSLDDDRDRAMAIHNRIDDRLDALESACTRLAERVGGVEARTPAVAETPAAPDLDALYAALEDAFRGSSELVKARVTQYLDEVNAAASSNRGEELVIDVGCGRGEWLEVLRHAGYQAIGIDSNAVFVQTCRAKGLHVTHGYALESLRQLGNGSVTGVTSMHVVEHLDFTSVIELLDECYRVLRPGGILILETPNPENIMVGAQYFYMDPTHRNPIPPGLLFWLTRARGFADVRVERLTAAREVDMPDRLPADTAGAESLNRVIDHFRQPVDYAVIARKVA